jgi:hypothetical protein
MVALHYSQLSCWPFGCFSNLAMIVISLDYCLRDGVCPTYTQLPIPSIPYGVSCQNALQNQLLILSRSRPLSKSMAPATRVPLRKGRAMNQRVPLTFSTPLYRTLVSATRWPSGPPQPLPYDISPARCPRHGGITPHHLAFALRDPDPPADTTPIPCHTAPAGERTRLHAV